MLGFCLLAPLADGVAKLIGDRVPLAELIAVRFAIQALIFGPLMWRTGSLPRLSRRSWGLVLLRTLLHISGIGLIVLALRFLPLADAIAIAYVMPFFMLLLGWAFLSETVGGRRLAACAVGFAGTLLVMQPQFAAIGWLVLLPIAVALIFALFMLVTRTVAHRIDPMALQAVGGGLGLAMLLPVMLLAQGSGIAELDPIWPAAEAMWLLLAMGLLGSLAHLLMSWALRFAPTATLAPMQYLEIPVAALVGLLLFQEFPNSLALVGIAIVMAAGLYVIWREQKLAKAPLPTTP